MERRSHADTPVCIQSLADYTIAMLESSFRKRQEPAGLRKCSFRAKARSLMRQEAPPSGMSPQKGPLALFH
jgi:hypothetical protein